MEKEKNLQENSEEPNQEEKSENERTNNTSIIRKNYMQLNRRGLHNLIGKIKNNYNYHIYRTVN